MKTKYAVHVPTQEDWDYVTKEMGYIWYNQNPNTCLEHMEGTYIDLEERRYKQSGYFFIKGYTLLSIDKFKEYRKLQKIYFRFYDKLKEPYSSQAKENWDFERCAGRIAANILDALILGFNWGDSPEKHLHWTGVFRYPDKYIAEPKQEWEPKKGEMVEVSNDGEVWVGPYEFIFKENRAERGYITIKNNYTLAHRLARPYNPKTKVTKQEIANWVGCDVDDLIIG